MLLTRTEALRRAQLAVDYKSTSYVVDARELGLYVLSEDERLRTLVTLIENVAKTDPEERDRVLAAAITAARAMVTT